MAITTNQFNAIADNIAKSLVDLETVLISNPANNAPTVATITAGQNASSNSLAARYAALSSGDQAGEIGDVLGVTISQVIGFLTVTKNEIYTLFDEYLAALDTDLGGLARFVETNSLQVHPEFAAAFNYVANQGQSLLMAGSLVEQVERDLLVTIPAANTFLATQQTLASVAVTGAAAGTFSAGTAIDTSKYGACPLALQNLGGSITTGTATSFTVTYTDAAGSHTVTKALTGALAAGAQLALNVSGLTVTGITVNSGGANTDSIGVVALPTRTVAY